MKVLFVSNSIEGAPSSFVESQGRTLIELGVEVNFFLVANKGIWGYLSTLPKLKKAIAEFGPQLIHAHYGLCGLLANLQRRLPVITTYHGSDINNKKVRLLSKICIKISAFNIFVSKKQIELAKPKKHFIIQPCGIATNTFRAMDKLDARKKMKLDPEKKIILFSNFFSMKVKNAQLAINAVKKIDNSQLIELKDYTPEQVCLLMNAADVALMTSFTEGSPLFIKEALACNCPVVSTDVGDVKELIDDLDGCSICNYDPDDVALKLIRAFKFAKISNGRERILPYDEHKVAENIKKIYDFVLYK